jgi:hypothetical protein
MADSGTQKTVLRDTQEVSSVPLMTGTALFPVLHFFCCYIQL